jgi:VanW like protein
LVIVARGSVPAKLYPAFDAMSTPAPAQIPAAPEAVPSRIGALLFALKARLLQCQRGIQNLLGPVARHSKAADQLPVQIAEVRAPLWTTEILVERSLQLGKVQNLRVAARALNGIVIPAGQTFSFWRQLGRTTRGRGYAAGRELREGCLVPAVGGGICQLSNALYDTALQSGCEIIERHSHSRVVPGSAAAHGRDATVAWNYVDLRFRPRQRTRIQVELSEQELGVSFWAEDRVKALTIGVTAGSLPRVLNPIAHTCTDCGVSSCFRHIEPLPQASKKTAFLLDECWPEFLDYIEKSATRNDFAAAPTRFGRYAEVRRLRPGIRNLRSTTMSALLRASSMRRARSVPARVQAQLLGSRQIADSMARILPFDADHIVVAQSLLPFLWSIGALGGRTFDVLMTRLPLARLHQLLDDTSRQHPLFSTLREYRAPHRMVDAEQEALANAHRVIAPHTLLAGLFGERSVQLPWHLPKLSQGRRGRSVVYPGPTVARKGALALRTALADRNCELMVLAGNLEEEDFWNGVHVAPSVPDWIKHAAVVVQPALLEDNPRPLLRAIAAGIPVICTPNCGVSGLPNVTTVEFGNVEQLRNAIWSALNGG